MILTDMTSNHKLINDCLALKDTYPIQSKAEERKMIEKMRNDRTQLNQHLILHNIRQAFNIAKKYRGKSQSYEDLLQRAMLGLSFAANKFDIDRNIKFCTFAQAYIFKYVTGDEYYYKGKEIDKASTSIYGKKYQDSDSDSANYGNSINANLAPGAYQENDAAFKDEIAVNDMKTICKNIIANVVSKYDKKTKSIYDKLYNQHMSVTKTSAALKICIKDVLKAKTKIRANIKSYLKDNYSITSVNDLF